MISPPPTRRMLPSAYGKGDEDEKSVVRGIAFCLCGCSRVEYSARGSRRRKGKGYGRCRERQCTPADRTGKRDLSFRYIRRRSILGRYAQTASGNRRQQTG